MARLLRQRERVLVEQYSLVFSDEDGAGFSFDCDKEGTPIFSNECQKKNYEECLKKDWVEDGEVMDCSYHYFTDLVVQCHCGRIVHINGDTDCDSCGQWYNHGGQELIPQRYWEE